MIGRFVVYVIFGTLKTGPGKIFSLNVEELFLSDGAPYMVKSSIKKNHLILVSTWIEFALERKPMSTTYFQKQITYQ